MVGGGGGAGRRELPKNISTAELIVSVGGGPI